MEDIGQLVALVRRELFPLRNAHSCSLAKRPQRKRWGPLIWCGVTGCPVIAVTLSLSRSFPTASAAGVVGSPFRAPQNREHPQAYVDECFHADLHVEPN